jgi:hypothetical protein
MHATTTAEITDHRPPISSFLEIAGKVGIVQRSSDIASWPLPNLTHDWMSIAIDGGASWFMKTI